MRFPKAERARVMPPAVQASPSPLAMTCQWRRHPLRPSGIMGVAPNPVNVSFLCLGFPSDAVVEYVEDDAKLKLSIELTMCRTIVAVVAAPPMGRSARRGMALHRRCCAELGTSGGLRDCRPRMHRNRPSVR
eukprot:7060175-Pyramimonas_sp.AAC.1